MAKPLDRSTSGHLTDGHHCELFAGAGGLAVGCREAGFPTAHLFEQNADCCATLRANTSGKTPTITGVVHVDDVSQVDWKAHPGKVAILTAGAPCQPFSLAGLHLAERDGRNLFPEVFRAQRELYPGALVVENVSGLTRKDFATYFAYIIAQAKDPSLEPKTGETWQTHFERLRRHQAAKNHIPEYSVTHAVLNAANHGVPQVRKRLFVVAFRGERAFDFPRATHSKLALVREQRDRRYWDLREVSKPRWSNTKEQRGEGHDGLLPWVTVRDVISSLPTAAASEVDASESADPNHWAIPGARSYPGHDGSRLDWPSKTIKAGVHGVPGGENSVITDAGRLRYYTLREAACIQTFPMQHVFTGARSSVTRQIGNAVPCLLASAVAGALARTLEQVGSRKADPRLEAAGYR